MPITVLKLGSPRKPNEGLRLGTVRRPPRGVPKTDFAKLDFYDACLPNLSPSAELVAFAQQSQDERSWKTFERKYRAEMNKPDAARLLDLLATLRNPHSATPTKPFNCGSTPPGNSETPFRNRRASASCWRRYPSPPLFIFKRWESHPFRTGLRGWRIHCFVCMRSTKTTTGSWLRWGEVALVLVDEAHTSKSTYAPPV